MAVREVCYIISRPAQFLGFLLVLTLAACGQSRVETYCSYGAVSEAQLQGCIEHVTEADIDNRSTNAADYARGELDNCLYDSGPYCEPR